MRRQEMIERKAESGDAGQNGHDEEDRGPANHPIPDEHAENRNETGGNRDQADDDVNDRIGRQTQTENHDAPRTPTWTQAAKSITLKPVPSQACAAFGHASMTALK